MCEYREWGAKDSIVHFRSDGVALSPIEYARLLARLAEDGGIVQRLFHQVFGRRRQMSIRMEEQEYVCGACGCPYVQLPGTARFRG